MYPDDLTDSVLLAPWIGLGRVGAPAAAAAFRMRMAVATAYRRSAMRKQRVRHWLALKRYHRPLIGAAASWFPYNWISIPFGLFSSTIISRVKTEQSLAKSLGWGVLINCFYTIKGLSLGAAIGPIQNVFPLFVVLYGVFLTLGEVGPGSTVVLTSSECFPTSTRRQMMGLVSAGSKAGAASGTRVFTAILSKYASDADKGNQIAFLVGVRLCRARRPRGPFSSSLTCHAGWTTI
ncbi:major facilitator superfamily transporter [Trichoderma cornu-damae]|uniref:Major facilitator superfamily transporter n=1 Tax=Trichoderma cornu-damae TaxID=654480 RepID=A0A9P8TV14_9HYPO|nr:major facilitator superfamily transporter [Trichoderma cornu-damae]